MPASDTFNVTVLFYFIFRKRIKCAENFRTKTGWYSTKKKGELLVVEELNWTPYFAHSVSSFRYPCLL